MRLIDADELIKERVENDPVRIAAICAPTVFNTKNVIKEIEYNKEISKKYNTGLREQGHIEAFDEAISIIKKGGGI